MAHIEPGDQPEHVHLNPLDPSELDTEHAGHQIGSRLLRAAEDVAFRRSAKAMGLEVGQSNNAARALYALSGYHFVARLPAYYQDGSDALRLEKRLNG